MFVRRMQVGEWRTARVLRVAALSESPRAFGSTVARERTLPEATWRARLSENAWFAAVDVRTAVGLACGIRTDTAEDRELTGVWVAPSHRGRGLGNALVAAVRDWAADEGARRLRLQVGSSNDRAFDLYRRHGFELAHPGPGQDVHGDHVVLSLGW